LVGYWRFDFLEDLGINNDGPDDVRDHSVLHNHLDLAGNTHLVQPDPIIPVELISFVAQLSDGKVELIWNTATEINNHGFEIERGSESKDWRTIGFIKGAGTTTEIQTYQFIDDLFGVNREKVLYRLKQIDFSGRFYYSSEIEITIPPVGLSLLQNYPNPFNPSTTIKFSLPVKTNLIISVYNMLGEMVAEVFKGELEEGYHDVEFRANSLASGIYFYRMEADKFVSVKKMIVIK
jgi:hypothetical protein